LLKRANSSLTKHEPRWCGTLFLVPRKTRISLRGLIGAASDLDAAKFDHDASMVQSDKQTHSSNFSVIWSGDP
jgi:hypothetical protein